MKDVIAKLIAEIAYWNARQDLKERTEELERRMEHIKANEELINMLAENRRMAEENGLVCPPDDVA